MTADVFAWSITNTNNINRIDMKQRTSHILMVRPASFGFNSQTAESNAFQQKVSEQENSEAQQIAISEFEAYVKILQEAGVTVNVIQDSQEPKKPDAIFPNNWVTFHEDGQVVLYPMCTPNRRWERRRSILEMLASGYSIKNEIDLSHYEADELFLEGTGSMILDRQNNFCYACLSVRTDASILDDFCQKTGFEAVTFHSVDENNMPIYHTNVMMAVAEQYVVVCMESIKDEAERAMLLEHFDQTGKEVVDISFEQVKQFCGNVIELESNAGESLLIMSERAYKGFTEAQKTQIEQYSKMVYAPIYAIEKIGGGGARCMLAEVFLPTLEMASV